MAMLGTAAFATLRIWAIWGHALVPTLAVFMISAIVPAINLYGYSMLTDFSVEEGNCVNGARFSIDVSKRQYSTLCSPPKHADRPVFAVGYTARSAAIASDLLVLILTWIRTADVWQESLKIKGFRPTLTVLFIRDGTLYFGLLLIMNIVLLFLDTFQPEGEVVSHFILVASALSANLIARFILDLRGVYRETSTGNHSRTTSSIIFDFSSSSDMGAPLGITQSTWVSSPADDIANELRDQRRASAAWSLPAGLEVDAEEMQPPRRSSGFARRPSDNDLFKPPES
ncbi:hypothetical protein EIP91_009372 [Steccherinum ochraceum]|uniref:Uncharacterized protein n=1 Tax=Steccherinum ochraceum TaxID=92696 RepID=A0A4R0R1R1_9APHY|nr:hypothetical protein EIP91_009372 [Steccherinum ochraceum]